ncbi:MAG: nucleotidyltransferase domain-containing protein [Cellulosilyticaceae bacterium]
MTFGLTPQDLDYIIATIQSFSEIKEAMIFGSRVKGTYKPGSDIDIAIVGDDINFDTLSKLHARLEETSPLPYLFDIVDYTHLTHDELKDHINRMGQIIFPAGKERTS